MTSAMDFTSMLGLLEQWDTDGDGLVSAQDFKQGLLSLGFMITQVCRLDAARSRYSIRLVACARALFPRTSLWYRRLHAAPCSLRRRRTACAARWTTTAW